ncbi:unnamed protein product [Rodentolepis nana]|uniref:Type III effector n=1 Tax=Rodentolepis nana TaxID=102285 RepID=A0A158QJJ9_RODNA|nr:unnamed protein product [Rodentolepis nana]
MQLAASSLPFGGVGNSGMGRYYEEASIATFSNPRSVLDKSNIEKMNYLFRYPPYTENHERWVRSGLSNIAIKEELVRLSHNQSACLLSDKYGLNQDTSDVGFKP